MSERIKKKLGTDNFTCHGKVISIAFTSLCVALYFVLDRFFAFYPTDSIKIGFSFIAVVVASVYVGPVSGMLTGGLGDLVGALLMPHGVPNPILTATAAAGGLVYGLLLYIPDDEKVTRANRIIRVVAANLICSIVLNLVINTYALALLQGGDNVAGYFWTSLPVRAVKECIMFAVRLVVCVLIMLPESSLRKALCKVKFKKV